MLFSFATKASRLDRGRRVLFQRLPELVLPTMYKLPDESLAMASIWSKPDPPTYVLKVNTGSMSSVASWLYSPSLRTTSLCPARWYMHVTATASVPFFWTANGRCCTISIPGEFSSRFPSRDRETLAPS